MYHEAGWHELPAVHKIHLCHNSACGSIITLCALTYLAFIKFQLKKNNNNSFVGQPSLIFSKISDLLSVHWMSYRLLTNVICPYAYLLKVILFSPMYVILQSLEFHLPLYSGHSAALHCDVLQHTSTNKFKLAKPIPNPCYYFKQFGPERV